MSTGHNAVFRAKPLDEQIDETRSDIRTDKLDMTYGEFSNMYEKGELVVAPEYQRLFRWKAGQKARFIESILLGIPTPAIFVAETADGIWELVDGLQRLSTILEFFGVLRNAEHELLPPSTLEIDESATLPALDGKTFEDLSLRSRLSIRRAGCRVEVIKVGSGRRMKYDIFERLNTGGTMLQPQEVRNCIFRAEAAELVEFFDNLAQYAPFYRILGLSDNQMQQLYHKGLVLRFFALKNDLDEFKHDVEPFITEFMHKIVDRKVAFKKDVEESLFKQTVGLIEAALGEDAWHHARDGRPKGAFSPYVYDALMLGVARNIDRASVLQKEDLGVKLNAIKADNEFLKAVGSGGNTKPKLLQRLAAADRILKA